MYKWVLILLLPFLGWSQIYSFQTFTNDFNTYNNKQQSFLIIGDMGADPQAPDTIGRLKSIGTRILI